MNNNLISASTDNYKFIKLTKDNLHKLDLMSEIRILPDHDYTGLIMLDDLNKVIGYGFIDDGYINNVYINPGYRNKGFGTLLVNEIMTRFKGNRLCVGKNKQDLINFYKTLGFKPYAEDTLFYYMNTTKDDSYIDHPVKMETEKEEELEENKQLTEANRRCSICGAQTFNITGICDKCWDHANEIDDDEKYESLSETLLEDKRTALISKSQNVGGYKNTKYGKNRFERKKYSKLAQTVQQYNKIDMNEFFKQDTLIVTIPVMGETDNYTVTIKMEGVCSELAKSIKSNNNKLEFKNVIQALTKTFNTADIYTKCTCQDFCLHPDTQIKLLNGKTLSVEELEKEFKNSKTPLYLYSVDEKGNFKPGKITNVWVRNYTDHMLKITLDNGKSIITTGEHPYMLRNGQYLPASELSIGQSLMPLYFGKTINGYETVKLNSASNTQFYSTYKQVADALLQKEIEEAKIRSGEDRIAIHHIDFNKNNNSPENLYPMGFEEHYKYHYNHVKESGVLDKFIAAGEEYRELVKDHTTPEYEKQAKVMSDTIKDYWANLSDEERENDSKRKSNMIKQAWSDGKYNTEKRKAADELRRTTLHTPEMELKSKEGTRNYWKNLSGEEREKVIAQRKQNLEKGIGWNKGKHLSDEDKLHKSLAALNKSPEEKAEHNKKIRDAKIYKVLNKMIEDKVDLTETNYEIYRTTYFPHSPKLDVQFDNINDVISYFKLNHKIISIEEINYDMLQPVYDIEVENYHNFYVDAGVILHNCYRFAHWNIVNNVSVDDTAHDPGPGKGIANPNDDKGRGCKHILLTLSNGDWLMKVASVINNYIHYAEEHMQKAFMKAIFPRLYGMPAEEAKEQNIIPEDINLETETNIIEIINDWAKNRGKFVKGSNVNPVQADKLSKEQQAKKDAEEETEEKENAEKS